MLVLTTSGTVIAVSSVMALIALAEELRSA